MLEIEQDEEIQSMRRFKRQFEGRRDVEKKKGMLIYEKEVLTMKEKDTLVEIYRVKEMQKIEVLRRVQNYALAKHYLRNVKVNAIISLFNVGFYPNEQRISLETDYIDWLVEATSIEIEEKRVLKESIDGLIDKETLLIVMNAKQVHLKEVEKKKRKAEERRINQSQNVRLIRICYLDTQKNPTHFAKHLVRFLDGSLSDWKDTFNAKNNILLGILFSLFLLLLDKKSQIIMCVDQVDSQEISEDQRLKTLEEEFPEVTQEYFGYGVNNVKKIGFTLAHSSFYSSLKKDKHFELVCFAISKEGRIMAKIDKDHLRSSNNDILGLNKCLKYKRDIRDHKQKVSIDEAIVLDLSQTPQDLWGCLFFVKLPNLVNNIMLFVQVFLKGKGVLETMKETDVLKYSRIGVEDYSNNIAIDSLDLLEKIQFDQLIQSPPNEDSPSVQNSYYLAYSLTKRPVIGWQVENIKLASKGMFEVSEETDYFNKVIGFWQSSEGMCQQNLEQSQISDNNDKPVLKNQRNVDVQSQMSITNESVVFQKCYKEYLLNFDQTNSNLTVNGHGFQELQEEFTQFIKKSDPSLNALSEWGFEFFFKGKELKRIATLKKCKNAFELEVRKKPEPLPEKVEHDEDSNSQNNAQQDQNSENDE